jgi:hypothetical protein
MLLKLLDALLWIFLVITTVAVIDLKRKEGTDKSISRRNRDLGILERQLSIQYEDFYSRDRCDGRELGVGAEFRWGAKLCCKSYHSSIQAFHHGQF